MNIEKERLECLAWLKTLGLNNVEFDENLYITSITRQSHCDLSTREIELMLRTWIIAKQQAVPEGFVVVPVEPTKYQIEAGVYAIDLVSNDSIQVVNVYKAMIQEAQK